ncbi:MAG: anthranilate phosphoribosyltransferase [Fibrobacterota bacterium]
MKEVLEHLLTGAVLPRDEAKELLLNITEDRYTAEQIASLLTIYAMRRIKPQELSGFRDALLERALHISLPADTAIDMCGTGGDHKDTFNISTLASLVVAGAGVPVIKHGNYGISSSCGSSDILESFGYKLTNSEETLQRHLNEAGFCYLHAPLFHPSMKSVGPVRKNLGIKTFFNMIGPLVNPVQPKYQLVGVFSPFVSDLYREVLKEYRENFSIVHSNDGYDEISLTDGYTITGPAGTSKFMPRDIGLPRYAPKDLVSGGTLASSRKIFYSVLKGEAGPAQRDVVLVNAAAALQTARPELSFENALERARKSLDSGNALQVLEKAAEERL